MPKIIVTSTFRKGGKGGKNGGAGGLLKYMGTREGVEKLPLGKENKPATKQQKSLIATVVSKIHGTAEYPEYREYLASETRGAAANFLNAVMQREEQAEDIGKLVTYMAERPGVVKLGKHGLFSQTDDPIDLEKAAADVTNHTGYIWTHVVSLHREDAERLGYNTAEAWKSLVRRNVIPPKKPVHLFAYLAKICRNFALKKLDWKAAAKRNAEVVSLTQEMELCIPDMSRDAELEGKELGRILSTFLRTLTPENRMVFVRRYWYVDTVADIAARYS